MATVIINLTIEQEKVLQLTNSNLQEIVNDLVAPVLDAMILNQKFSLVQGITLDELDDILNKG